MHEIISSTHTNATVLSVVMQRKDNVPMNITPTDASEADWKPVESWKVICQVSEKAS